MTPELPKSPKDRLIFALDVDALDSAERLVRELAPHVGMFKVGSQLFTSVGPLVIDLIHGMGASIFLDLKFHDIPATVAGAVREAARHRAQMLTVHSLGGPSMIKTAASELLSITLIPGVPPPLILGVTVLTSHSEESIKEIGLSGPVVNESVRLAKMAVSNGASGVVASAHELSSLREVLPAHTVYVTPGIREKSESKGDQARVMTARQAVEAGATYVVVGRPIRDAVEPADAAKRIVDQIASAQVPT